MDAVKFIEERRRMYRATGKHAPTLAEWIPAGDICTTIRECGGIDRLRVRADADKGGRLVVHGQWMHEETEGGFHIWRCSRCGRGMNDNPEGIDSYCYHCGAKMDGGDNDAAD